MAEDIVIVGAGGFGREVLDIIEAINVASGSNEPWRFRGFVDDVGPDTFGRGQVIGGLECLQDLDAHVALAIGDSGARQRVGSGCTLPQPALVHPISSRGVNCELGEGVIIAAGVRLTTRVRLGDHVHLNLNATIGHDVEIGSFSTVFPGVNVSGSVKLGKRVSLGTNSCVLQGLKIEDDVFVGAGAVVTKDLPLGVTAVGIPARW